MMNIIGETDDCGLLLREGRNPGEALCFLVQCQLGGEFSVSVDAGDSTALLELPFTRSVGDELGAALMQRLGVEHALINDEGGIDLTWRDVAPPLEETWHCTVLPRRETDPEGVAGRLGFAVPIEDADLEGSLLKLQAGLTPAGGARVLGQLMLVLRIGALVLGSSGLAVYPLKDVH